MIVHTRAVADEELYAYYTELFKRPRITDVCTVYGEQPDISVAVQHVRSFQEHPEGMSVMYLSPDLRLVGAAIGVVAPCFYGNTRYAMEVSISTLPTAPLKTVLRLHRYFAGWAKEQNCKFAQVSDGPYTPGTYAKLLTRLDYEQIGGVYLRRL